MAPTFRRHAAVAALVLRLLPAFALRPVGARAGQLLAASLGVRRCLAFGVRRAEDEAALEAYRRSFAERLNVPLSGIVPEVAGGSAVVMFTIRRPADATTVAAPRADAVLSRAPRSRTILSLPYGIFGFNHDRSCQN